ncbi:unnamed protein product, partial [Meganyctiphanes norvegica]
MADKDSIGEVGQRILNLCAEFKEGITVKIIQNDMPTLDQREIVTTINKLLSKSLIDLLKKGDKEHVFKLRDPGSLHRVKGADPEEQMVYKIIEECGKIGTMLKEVMKYSNFFSPLFGEIPESLAKKRKNTSSYYNAPKRVAQLNFGKPNYSAKDNSSDFGQSEEQQRWETLISLNLREWQFPHQRPAPVKVRSGSPQLLREHTAFVIQDKIAKTILELCRDQHIRLIPVHLRGVLNVLADQGSRECPISTEWSLDKASFSQICDWFGRPQLDLFATRDNCQLERFISPCPDRSAILP